MRLVIRHYDSLSVQHELGATVVLSHACDVELHPRTLARRAASTSMLDGGRYSGVNTIGSEFLGWSPAEEENSRILMQGCA